MSDYTSEDWGGMTIQEKELRKEVERLRARVERLEHGVRQAIDWFERPEPWIDGEKYPLWQDAADHLRKFSLEEVSDE